MYLDVVSYCPQSFIENSIAHAFHSAVAIQADDLEHQAGTSGTGEGTGLSADSYQSKSRVRSPLDLSRRSYRWTDRWVRVIGSMVAEVPPAKF